MPDNCLIAGNIMYASVDFGMLGDGILTDIQKALSPDPNSQDERNRSSATADLAKSAIDA